MRWSKLIGLLVAALGIGTLCCSGAHLFGSHLRYIQNPMDNLSGWSFVAQDLFAPGNAALPATLDGPTKSPRVLALNLPGNSETKRAGLRAGCAS